MRPVLANSNKHSSRMRIRRAARLLEPLESRHLLSTASIPITNSRDMVFDSTRNILDIPAADGNLYRYDVSARQMLTPITVGGTLGYGDITPDSHYLYVTDLATTALHKIDLNTLNSQTIVYASGGEGAAWGIVITSNSDAYIDANYYTLGSFYIRPVDLTTDTVGDHINGSPYADSFTNLFRSADGSAFYAASNRNTDPVLYNVTQQSVVAMPGNHSPYINGRDAALSRDGSLLAINSIVVDDQFKLVASGLPTGALAFSPARDRLFILPNDSNTLDIYDTSDFHLMASLKVPQNYAGSSYLLDNLTFARKLVLSSDGNTLFYPSAAGIQVVDVSEPHLAAPLVVTGNAVNGHLVLTANFNLSGLPLGYTPTGTVTFRDGNNNVLGTVTLTDGSGNLITNLTPTTNLLSVSYSGDLYFNSQQVAGSMTVAAQQTYLTITPPYTKVYSPRNGFTASVLDSLGNAVTDGTVSLHFALDGTSTAFDFEQSGTGPDGQRFIEFDNLPAGTWHVSGTFTPVNYYAQASTSPILFTVTKGTPFIRMGSYNASFSVQATYLDDPFSGDVSIYDGNALLATLPLVNGQAVYNGLAMGVHSMSVKIAESENFVAVSTTPMIISFLTPSSTAVTTLVLAPVAGQSIPFTAYVTPGAKGTVSFVDGTKVLGSAPVNSAGMASFTAALGAGSHSVRANFVSTNNYATSTSLPLVVNVAQPVVVDLLALYTSTVLAASFHFDTILSFMKTQIMNANQALANSGVAITIRLVSLSFVNYTESGKMGTDLDRLDTPNDGVMDNVQVLRNAVGADLVVLIDAHITYEDADPNIYTSGIADALLNTNSPSRDQTAYMVIAQDDPQGDYVLAHEVAHTFGATHAVGDPTDKGATNYAHGYRFFGNDGQQYHDIMAYDPGTTIPYFSNPSIFYQGQPIGNSVTADVARLLREQGPRVAAYRSAGIIGGVDVATATTLAGWFLDPKVFDTSLMMRVDIDGITRGTFAANLTRPDLSPAFGATNHGFSYTLPVLLGGTHKIVLYVQDAATGTFVPMATKTITTITPLFDENYYLKTYPDVANAVKLHLFASGYDHFIKTGQFEGRNPSPYFDTKYYLAHNPDLAAAAAKGQLPSPFAHYLARGQYEGRLASPYFDERYYRLAYPDVAAAIKAGVIKSGLEHFLQFGQFENRSPIPYFDAANYKANNPSVTGSAYANFLYFGNAAGLAASIYFDQAAYLSLNPDVAQLIANKQYVSALDHYLRVGRSQGRPFSTRFSEASYLAKNPDIAAAVRAGVFSCGFEHWLLAGRFENRQL